LRGADSIAQIALACGFADFGHFSRRYKDAFGASPREDRVTLRNGQRRGPLTPTLSPRGGERERR
jgi:AraC family carnitine catabolism transcriptional activator